MAQAKKKTATKTTKKQSARQTQARRQATKRTNCKRQQQNNQERFHVYVVTALSLIAGILLCANAAVMMVV